MSHLKNSRFRFSTIGFLAFALQELPYIPWLLWSPADNPLAGNVPVNPLFGAMEGIGGVVTVTMLIMVVRCDTGKITFRETIKNLFFMTAFALLLIYYICWVAYFEGVTSPWLIVFGLSAPVPLYYLFIALWRKNTFAIVTAILFFIGHTISNAINYLG